MVKAIWNGVTLAESGDTIIVDRTIYFPPSALVGKYFRSSTKTTTCPNKGLAHYFDIIVSESVNINAAWSYPEPKPVAENIRGYVAFWQGVEIV